MLTDRHMNAKKKPRAKVSTAKPPRRQAALAAKDALLDDARRGKT